MTKIKTKKLVPTILAVLVAVTAGWLYVKWESGSAILDDLISLNQPRYHNFEWSNLKSDHGRMSYGDANWDVITGVDVSKHQGEIDWKSVKEDGISFAMIRAGYRGYGSGIIKEDDCFRDNITRAAQVGMDVGVYFFSQAISKKEAREEARFVGKLIKKYNVNYPVVFDMEYVTENDRIRGLDVEQKTGIAQAFCKEISKLGYKPMIYGSTSWLQNHLLLDKLSKYELWVAGYAEAPSFPYAFRMWQYTDEGEVNGISGNVDLNMWFCPKN